MLIKICIIWGRISREASPCIFTQRYFNEDNKDREIKGLMEALEKFNLKEGIILTYKQDDEFKIKDKKIKVLPVWKWLVE